MCFCGKSNGDMGRKSIKKQGSGATKPIGSTDKRKADEVRSSNLGKEPDRPVLSLPRLFSLSSKMNKALFAAGLAVTALFFLVLKSFSIHPYAGDEFIYLYQGKLISEGVRPYADFAMAHPPVQALFTAFMFKIFGVHFTMMRLFPILWCLAGGIGLSLMARREIGSLAAILAAGLFLFAHEPLRASSHFTGVNMTVALMIFTVFAYRREWIRTAAALAVLAVFTRLYAIPGVLALVMFAFVSDRKAALRLVIFGGIFGAAAFVLIGFWTGFGAMIHNIFLYHVEKTAMSESALFNMRDTVLFHNATLAALFALSLPFLFANFFGAYVRTDAKQSRAARLRTAAATARLGLPILCAFTAIVFLILLLNMNRVWMYYFIPAFPFAAVASGYMISTIAIGAYRLIQAKGNLSNANLSFNAIIGGATVVLLFTISFFTAFHLEEQLAYFKGGEDSSEERSKVYTFVPSVLLGPVNDMVKSLFWQDERVVGTPYNAITFYLWHESRVFDITDQVVDIIQKETSTNGRIFGDSGTVPLFALLSGRDIAGDEADTNIQRYRSGNADPKELISKIDNYKTEMIILRRRFGVAGVKEVQTLIETKYRKVTDIGSAQGWVFEIYKRRSDLS
jgi:hypothetical protein